MEAGRLLERNEGIYSSWTGMATSIIVISLSMMEYYKFNALHQQRPTGPRL